MNKGTLIGASLGPGDAGLITRKAWQVLQAGGLWCYPVRRKGGQSHALGIVERTEIETPADAIALVFPMTHDAEVLSRAWARAANQIIPALQAGRDVVFLVEGDASTFSTFTYLARYVQNLDADIEVETIAGVPSFNAAAASTAFPLAETDDTIAIVPAGYGLRQLDTLLPHFDTLVLLKVKPLLDLLIDWIDNRALLPHALFIEKAGAPEERIVRDITQLKGKKVNYLSLILLRNPHRARGEVVRGCRKKNFMNPSTHPHPCGENIALVAITKHGAAQAARLAPQLPQATIITSQKFASAFAKTANTVQPYEGALRAQIPSMFAQHDQLIFFVSLGAVVRLIAPHLVSKDVDPGVLVVDDAGQFIIPVLSGHVGGANAWAEHVAGLIGATAVLTTASDVGKTIPVDILGRGLGWKVEAPKINITRVSAHVVNEEPIALIDERTNPSMDWWTRPLPLPATIHCFTRFEDVALEDFSAVLWITEKVLPDDIWERLPEQLVVYRP